MAENDRTIKGKAASAALQDADRFPSLRQFPFNPMRLTDSPRPRPLRAALLLVPCLCLTNCSPAVNDAQLKEITFKTETSRAELVTLSAQFAELEKEAASLRKFEGQTAADARKEAESLMEERDSLVDLRRQVQEKIATLKAGEAANRETLAETKPN